MGLIAHFGRWCASCEPPSSSEHREKEEDGWIARQWLLGVVQTAEGLPIAHQVFPSNTAEVPTLLPPLERLLTRYPIRRVILVADRGLLSLENLAELEALALPAGTTLSPA